MKALYGFHGSSVKYPVICSSPAISIFLVLLLTLLALAASPARAQDPQGLPIGWGHNGYGQLPTPSTVAAGSNHSLVLTAEGKVVAWGLTTSGQCVVPPAAQSGVIAIAGGAAHSLALTDTGEVIAWGLNDYGQCTVPAAAQSGIIAIAAGYKHSLALTDAGKVLAWGQNGSGQCTVPAAAQSGIIAIAAGQSHSLALTSAGAVIAWGYDAYGQCAVPAAAQSGIAAIAGGGSHSLALTSAGEVIAWGQNGSGQCTVPAAAQSGIVAIAAGSFHSLALTAAGEVIFWGYDNGGLNTVPATAQSGIIAIAAGVDHSLALTSAGEVIAWGYDSYGQCTVPTQAQSAIVAIAAGMSHTLAMTLYRRVIAWGDDSDGQCTVPIEPGTNVMAVAAGHFHSLALVQSTGEVIAWGYNAYNQSTVPAGAQSDVIAIAAGGYHNLALTTAGDLIAWGKSAEGQCTVPPEAQSGVVAIAGGAAHSLALTDAGEVIAWGDDTYGQCTMPVAAQSGVVAIAGGAAHSLALTDAGEVIAWGNDTYGQCTVPMGAQSGIIAIAAGGLHSLAVNVAGEVIAWGDTSEGQCTIPAEAQIGVLAVAAGYSHSLALRVRPPTADVVGSPTSGEAPLTVSFQNWAEPTVTSWEWDFGDGATSIERMPHHVYRLAGLYDVSLTVTRAGISSTTKKFYYISVYAAANTAGFSASPTTGVAPLTVDFTDLSTGDITGWLWDFGDSATSDEPSPTHVYADSGLYTVTLDVTGPPGSATETKEGFIVVVTDPVADFSATPTSGPAPLTVDFTDLSTGIPSSWEWDFGDGGTSTQQNPSHTYTDPGSYTASLTATNAAGSDTETKVDYIMVAFQDVDFGSWACDEILACVDAGIIAGYDDGLYRPDTEVTRDQMAVYVARALAGGETGVPDGPDTPTFTDVPNTGYGDGDDPYWAYKYVEYAVNQNVVQGYEYPDPDTPGETISLYAPLWTVPRDQMAVYIARALVAPTGEAALADYVPADPRNFPDVPTTGYGDSGTDPYWAYTHIEYCVENGVVNGYEYPDPDAPGETIYLYEPLWPVTRDQMAVFIARAFELPT